MSKHTFQWFLNPPLKARNKEYVQQTNWNRLGKVYTAKWLGLGKSNKRIFVLEIRFKLCLDLVLKYLRGDVF